jgi:single-strand DNA-binding protein
MTATITVQGGLTSAPELRYSQSGLAIASGTVASTDRYLDKQTQEWKDGKKLFLRWSAFKDIAENIAASQLDKGAQVTVTGKLHTREWEDNNGQKRSSTELEVTDFSVSLRKATVTVQKSGQRAASPEVWSTPAAPAQDTFGGVSYGDDSPF